MPYIDNERRPEIRERAEALAEWCETAGDMNYAITQLLLAHLPSSAFTYAGLNEAVGVLECAKLEFYRRMAVPYEEQKKQENGDVYPP